MKVIGSRDAERKEKNRGWVRGIEDVLLRFFVKKTKWRVWVTRFGVVRRKV